jgi:hypothetical protein
LKENQKLNFDIKSPSRKNPVLDELVAFFEKTSLPGTPIASSPQLLAVSNVREFPDKHRPHLATSGT